LLAKYPTQEVQILVVWLAMYGNETRTNWSADLFTDPRAIHFWDSNYTVGRWFGAQMEGGTSDDIVWDKYYLFPAQAKWDTVPAPLVSKGATLYSKREQLKNDLTALWAK